MNDKQLNVIRRLSLIILERSSSIHLESCNEVPSITQICTHLNALDLDICALRSFLELPVQEELK